MNAEMTKKIVENKCYHVLCLKDIYENLLKTVQTSVSKLNDQPDFYVSYIAAKSKEMKMTYHEYVRTRHDLSQIVHALGDEYIEIMNSILKEE